MSSLRALTNIMLECPALGPWPNSRARAAVLQRSFDITHTHLKELRENRIASFDLACYFQRRELFVVSIKNI